MFGHEHWHERSLYSQAARRSRGREIHRRHGLSRRRGTGFGIRERRGGLPSFEHPDLFSAREPFTTWRKNNLVRILLQTGRKRDVKMPNVPTIHELMTEYKTPESTRGLAIALLASGDLGRPFITPPGILPDRLKILRDGVPQNHERSGVSRRCQSKKARDRSGLRRATRSLGQASRFAATRHRRADEKNS